jgi:diketogulonate reductase-like aldo/keto reductase
VALAHGRPCRLTGISVAEPRRDADAPFFADRIERHPRLSQWALREYCEDPGIEVVGDAPLARGALDGVEERRE